MQPCGQKRHGCTADPKHECRGLCHEPCEACTVPVDKALPCGHVYKSKCNADVAEQVICMQNCEKTLACGHKCSKTCAATCEPCPVTVSDQTVRFNLSLSLTFS